ncbi:hypothetical protein GCM10009789_37330 [Kribbella sancticallisti]|uniref:HMA domain-containing protein n=1 Tax=Kribbella sancticallisti TaxID=460087 RepID=A0ABN2DP37_9ACTN
MNEQLVLRVLGMDCAACEQRLAYAVRRVEGVRYAVADHGTGVLEVHLMPGTDREAVAARVVEAGFTVTGVETR